MLNFEDYFRGADKVLRGLNSIGAALGLHHETAATFGPVLTLARQKVAAFAAYRAGKLTTRLGLKELRPEVDEFLENVRNHLTGPLGSEWSELWVPLGFDSPVNGLQLPRTDEGRCRMLGFVKDYFTANPQHENTAELYTADRADDLCGPITQAKNALDGCKEDGRTRLNERKTALRSLDKKISRVRNELETLLEPLDPRWLKFFDRIPGDPRRPEKVVDVSVTVEPGRMLLDWSDAERAARYKLEKLVVGLDEDFVVVKLVEDSDADVQLPDVTTGTVVKLRVTALNGVGPGTPSDVIELQAA